MDAFTDYIINQLPASQQQLQQIKQHQLKDEISEKIVEDCRNGRPHTCRSTLKGALKSFLPVAQELSVHNGQFVRGSMNIIPASLQHTQHTLDIKALQSAREEQASQFGGQVFPKQLKTLSRSAQPAFHFVSSPPNLCTQHLSVTIHEWPGFHLEEKFRGGKSMACAKLINIHNVNSLSLT